MIGHCQFVESRRQRGAALLIAIFALLLVSVVAIALIVSSGTDSALASNYRTSASAYYAALAGIEEARGRLLGSSPNPIPIGPMPLTQVIYIINPLNGETVAPQDTSNPMTYPDAEYKQEFGVDVGARAVAPFNSVSAVAGLPGPLYKWVRINAVTEQALGDGPTGTGPAFVDVNGSGTVDNVTPLYYDPANINASHTGMVPGLVDTLAPPATAVQALEITAYAVLPNGSQKMLQAVVRPLVEFPNLNSQTFSAALTLAGNGVTFTGPGTASFIISGQDPCPGAAAMLPAIGYGSMDNAGNTQSSNNFTANPPTPTSNYVGSSVVSSSPPPPPASPGSIVNVSSTLNLNWLTPSGLDAVVQDITNGADAVITGPATPGSFPSGMSANHPMTIVVNGDLDLNGWHNTGYGLLLVTGTLKYDPDASWQGVVLVIGQGNFVSTKGGTGQIDGAVFIAKTRDGAGSLLNSLGPSSFSQTGNGSNLGNGIRYNSCYVKSAMGPITYKVVSFREIPLAN